MNNDIGKPIVERIEKALRTLGYQDAEIALILAQLDKVMQDEIGEEVLSSLPADQQEAITKIVESNGDMTQLAAMVPKLSKEGMTKKIEEKMTKAAEAVEQAATDADTAEQKIRELLKSQPNQVGTVS